MTLGNAPRLKDEVGNVYGRLVVLARDITKPKTQAAYWKCLCDCGRIISTRGTSLRNFTTKSCGCLNLVILKSQTGEKNPCWRGGTASAAQKFKSTKPYMEWRQAVFAKDNYTCAKCKQRGGKIESHHISNYAEHEELRTTLSNGITFCFGCHKAFHAKYGRKSNTYAQLVEFITGELNNAFFTEYSIYHRLYYGRPSSR